MLIINLLYVILAFMYGIILLKEDDRKLTKFLAIVLLVISSLGFVTILAMELSR